MIRILIADDHQVVRRGMRQMLEHEPDFEVVGEAADGNGILALLESGIEADVLLTDFSMPVMDGIELAKAMAEKFPAVQIIIITIQEEESYIQQAFQAGVKSYLFKTADSEELLFAIRQVARKFPYLCAGLCDKLIKRIVTSVETIASEVADVEFSDREMEVLRHIAEGYTNEEVADRLYTSRRTVESHRQSMIDKSGSRNSLALIAYAMRHGLLT